MRLAARRIENLARWKFPLCRRLFPTGITRPPQVNLPRQHRLTFGTGNSVCVTLRLKITYEQPATGCSHAFPYTTSPGPALAH